MRVRTVLPAGLAAVLILAVVLVARSRYAPPARCADGMTALGPRCCGEGQSLQGDACSGAPSRCAQGLEITPEGCVARATVVELEGGHLMLGPGDWDLLGVVAPLEADVLPFRMDAYEVNFARYSGCVAAGVCPAVGPSGEPGRAVSSLTAEEAGRFCAFAGGDLPLPEQLAWATAGKNARRYAWGETGAVCRRAAWGLVRGPCGKGAAGPEIAGSHPDDVSPEGVFDLAGNVAEWTRPPPDDAPVVEVRGGSYEDDGAKALRSWNRRELDAQARNPSVGFRCVYPVSKPDKK